MLKAPGAKRLKLKYDEPLSNFAISFNFCRYIEEKREHEAKLKKALIRMLNRTLASAFTMWEQGVRRKREARLKAMGRLIRLLPNFAILS